MGHSADSLAQYVLCLIGTGSRGCNLRMSTLTISFQHYAGGSRQCNQEKINHDLHIEPGAFQVTLNHDIHVALEEAILPIFIGDMVPYVEIPRNQKERKRERENEKKKKGKTVLDPINSFIKVAGFNCVSKY